MKIIVVYESMFGNTKTVGEGIAEGLSETADVRLGSVDEIVPDEVRDADLVVAGGPTHAYGMARADAHESLATNESFRRYGVVLPGRESLRGWLDRLPPGRVTAAAFDTRYPKPALLTGSAAKKIENSFDEHGYRPVSVRSFFVQTAGGPLVDGERDRAVAWGRELAAALTSPHASAG